MPSAPVSCCQKARSGFPRINSGNLGFRIEYEWFDVAPEYDNSSGEFVDKLDASAGFFSASVFYMF